MTINSELIISLAIRIINPPPPDPRSFTSIVETSHINEIWKQANIRFEECFRSEATEGWYRRMKPYIECKVLNPDPYGDSQIIGYYSVWSFTSPSIEDSNGFSIPARSRAYAVKSEPQLTEPSIVSKFRAEDRIARVSSHEIGHILGLDHFHSPASESDRLMFEGSKGTRLTQSEVDVARETAYFLLNES